MRTVVVIALLICFLQACTKTSVIDAGNKPSSSDTPSANDSLINLITGKWIWEKSEGGFSYHVDNPSNTGNQLMLQFTNAGTVFYYKNGEPVYSGKYSLEIITDTTTGSTLYAISQNYFGMYSEAEKEVLHITSDEITFDEPGADRYTHTYRRIIY